MQTVSEMHTNLQICADRGQGIKGLHSRWWNTKNQFDFNSPAIYHRMFSFSKLTTALILAILPLTSTSAFASPLAARATCNPNFEGNHESIYVISGLGLVSEWTPVVASGSHITLVERSSASAFATGEFLVAFTGAPTNPYKIT